MIKIYGLKNCDTCRKALKWLKAQRIEAELIDIRDTPLGETGFERFLNAFGPDKLINKRGTTWRQLPDAEKAGLSPASAPGLLSQHPALMKRPVFDADGTLSIGFDAAVQQELSKYSRF